MARKRAAQESDVAQAEDAAVEPAAAGDPGECAETPCWSRTAVTVSETMTSSLHYNFSSSFGGTVAWEFGDGAKKKARGPVSHIYAAAGPQTVKAVPVASSCFKVGTKAVVVA